jgi:hypothetical protein
MKMTRLSIHLLIAPVGFTLLPTGCVKTRTVSQGGQVISKGPVLVSPIRGTLRSHTDRR